MALRFINALLLCVVITFFSCGGKKSSTEEGVVRPVKTTTVRQTNSFEKDFAGVVESDKVSSLGFKAGGQLISLTVNDGDWVEKGRVIAALDPRERDLKLIADKASYEAAKSQYERYKSLLARQAISQQEYEVSQTSFEQAKAVYENTLNLISDLKLTAPFSGFILEKKVDNYQTVQAGQEVVKLVDPNDLVVKLTLADKNLEYLLSNPKFFVSVETIPGVQFAATLRDYVDASPYGLGIPVTLKITDPSYGKYKKSIKPGFSVNVTMEVFDKNSKAEIVVPLVAVASEMSTKKNYVWVINQSTMTVNKRYVELGPLYGVDQTSIKSGLKNGEVVVTAGVYQLAEGQKVKVLPN